MKPKKNLARIMYGDPVAFDNDGNPFAFKPVLYAKRSKLHSRAFAVIPTATAQQARKLAAFWNLTEEERVERLAKDMFAGRHKDRPWESWKRGSIADECRSLARSLLSAITGRKAEGAP